MVMLSLFSLLFRSSQKWMPFLMGTNLMQLSVLLEAGLVAVPRAKVHFFSLFAQQIQRKGENITVLHELSLLSLIFIII